TTVIVADCATSPNPMPAALIILILVDGIRYGLPGVVGAWIAAEIVVGAALSLQMTTLRVLGPALGLTVLMRWGAITLAAAAVIGLLLWVGQERLRQEWARCERERTRLLQQLRDERSQWETERAALRRAGSRVSDREGEILRLLVREDLTYEQIAEHLDVSADTVKTHVHRLAKKLGVSGRRSIVEAARARDLLPPAD
ncbi:MAG: LuxR C-terminal-related transcriptional regulator, partial [Candidatus Dormibacteraceae bacterium]